MLKLLNRKKLALLLAMVSIILIGQQEGAATKISKELSAKISAVLKEYDLICKLKSYSMHGE